MTYVLLACPKCHAGYKMSRESAQNEVTCRSCGHKWVPAPVAVPVAAEAAAKPASPPAADPLQTLADAVKSSEPASRSGVTKTGGDTTSSSHLGSVLREDLTDPLVGTVINGFKILSRVGSGGFGVVYRAFDTNLQRSVAIKMLPPKIAKSSQGLVDRFLREARSAAKLSHPNIVMIHQICQYKDTYYIVMELVDGGALHEFLAVQKRFAPDEATRIVRSAAEGLGHAHRRGIIHRDIKPGNIMMTNDGQVKVSDFGLARDVLQGRDIVGPGHSLGTPRYMAPEQALGGEPTSASDLYSLAATYYALLTGHPPFEGASDRELMKKHVTERVPDPRQHVATLPAAVYRFFETAMAKEPEDRYQTAEEFVEALDRLDFSDGSKSAPAMQALKNQIGGVGADNRGSHLTEAIESAVRRGSTGRTPSTSRPTMLEQRMASRKSAWPPWAKWALIAGGAVLLVVAAIIVAYVLHLQRKAAEAIKTPGGDPPFHAPVTPTAAAPVNLPVSTPTAAAAVKPQPKRKATDPVIEAEPPEIKAYKTDLEAGKKLREQNAQEALKAAQAYEAESAVNRNYVRNYYQDSVINNYPGTEAAKEAQKAVDRINKQMEGGAVTPEDK